MIPAACCGAMKIAINGTAMPPEPWPKPPFAMPVMRMAMTATT